MDLYHVLKQCDMNSIKISEIITDHQATFFTNIGDRSITHYDLMKEIEFAMYPSLTKIEKEERRNENLHIFLIDLGAYISFPENGRMSLPQCSMMIDFIKEISKYNREVPSIKRIPISIDGPIRMSELYDISDLDEKTVKEWKKYLRSPKELDREEIIGEEYSSSMFKRIFK